MYLLIHRFILEKCKNQITIENKKKADMIKELQARGYDVDPVRAWKARTDKESLLVIFLKVQFLYQSL